MRLWPLPHAEGSRPITRKKTLRSNSSSLEMSMPGGGELSSPDGPDGAAVFSDATELVSVPQTRTDHAAKTKGRKVVRRRRAQGSIGAEIRNLAAFSQTRKRNSSFDVPTSTGQYVARL